MTVWFTSDTHFFHYNVIEFCNRQIGINPRLVSRDEAVEAMNETLVRNWNDVVGSIDDVYHLGDFGFSGITKIVPILEKLNGVKHLIEGNHDSSLARKEEFRKHFQWVRDYTVLKVHDKDENEKQFHQPIVLCHFPILSWENMGHGAWHLHGHTHGSIGKLNAGIRRLDVGVDSVAALGMGMRPISYEEVKNIMLARGIKPPEGDYHGRSS